MNSIKTIGTILLLLLSIVGLRQSDSATSKTTSSGKIHFSTINQIGLIVGADGPQLELQSINGVRYNSWFAGAGIGLDYYYSKSIAVFMDVRKNLFIKTWPVYLYADAGINIPWVKKLETWEGKHEYEKGLYYDAGFGYRFRISNQSAIIINAGYSVKAFTEKISTGSVCIGGPCPEDKEQVNYQLRRISIKAGLQF